METQAQETLREVAAGSAAAARVLERHRIVYWCAGERLFDDVCREKGLSPAAVKSDIADAVATLPKETKDWGAAPLRELIRHIVTTHHEYLKLELPRVGQKLRAVVEAHGETDPAALHELEAVYEGLWQEMNLHMHKEEMMLFPFIERYEAAAEIGSLLPLLPFGRISNPIAVMEAEHDSADSALVRIRELTINFQAPPDACSTYRALLDGLKEIELDLHLHIHLESNILFPRIIALEEHFSGGNQLKPART